MVILGVVGGAIASSFMWQLTGQKGEEKLDPGARDSTIKRLAAFYSTPTVIEDNASSNKVQPLKVKPEKTVS